MVFVAGGICAEDVRMKLKYAVAALVMALSSVAQAQDGPSYEETVRFLQSKLNVTYSRGSINTLVELDRCIFAEIQSGQSEQVRIQYFQASDIDPSRVDLIGGSVHGQYSVHAFALRNINAFPFFVVVNRASGFDLQYLSSRNCNDGSQGLILNHPRVAQLINIDENIRVCYSDENRSRNATPFLLFNYFLTPSSDNAPRVQRALQHLIRLCGGREELF
jgi:hypothetical protein